MNTPDQNVMDISDLPRHPWPRNIAKAREIQNQLGTLVCTQSRFGRIKHIAGVDIGINKKLNQARAAVAVLSFPQLEVIETRMVTQKIRFPYIPGYLSFREVPALLAAIRRLKLIPNLIICDGQGYAHPRRFGLACHLGVLTDIPTIGAAKSRLIGKYEEPGEEKGDWSSLVDKQETIGAVVRTRSGVKPMFISSGHRVALSDAKDIVLQCCSRYRLPETTRVSHRLASG